MNNTTYKLKVKLSVDTIYLVIALGEMYARMNPDSEDNIAPLVQFTMRAGLETIKQAENSDLITIEIFQYEMLTMISCLFIPTTLDTFLTAFRSKEFAYYNAKENVSCDDLQNGINDLESFLKEAYSKLPVGAIH